MVSRQWTARTLEGCVVAEKQSRHTHLSGLGRSVGRGSSKAHCEMKDRCPKDGHEKGSAQPHLCAQPWQHVSTVCVVDVFLRDCAMYCKHERKCLMAPWNGNRRNAHGVNCTKRKLPRSIPGTTKTVTYFGGIKWWRQLWAARHWVCHSFLSWAQWKWRVFGHAPVFVVLWLLSYLCNGPEKRGMGEYGQNLSITHVDIANYWLFQTGPKYFWETHVIFTSYTERSWPWNWYTELPNAKRRSLAWQVAGFAAPHKCLVVVLQAFAPRLVLLSQTSVLSSHRQ